MMREFKFNQLVENINIFLHGERGWQIMEKKFILWIIRWKIDAVISSGNDNSKMPWNLSYSPKELGA